MTATVVAPLAAGEGPTSYRPRGHLVVWSTRQLPDELRAPGMLLALDAIWRDVNVPTTRPGSAGGPGTGLGPRRLVVVDEAWTLLRDGEGGYTTRTSRPRPGTR